MEKQMHDQQSKELEAKREKTGLSDFAIKDSQDSTSADDNENKSAGRKHPLNEEDPAEPLAPFRRSGEPGSRK